MADTLPLSIVADELARLRSVNPLVHLLTNEVVQEITANVLLAAGAAPAMIVAEEEAAAFVAISGALLVNVGTLYPARLAVMQQADRRRQPGRCAVNAGPGGGRFSRLPHAGVS